MQATFLSLNNLQPTKENSCVVTFYENLESHLKTLDPPMSFYKLQFLSGIPSGTFSQWKKGKRSPSDTDLTKLEAVKELGLSLNKLRAWKLLDEFDPETIEEAWAQLEGER